MVTLPTTTTTTTYVYFLGSFIFPSILLLRERPKRGDIFLESDEHMFLKYQNFSMCLNVEKWNEKKTRRAEEDQASNGDHWYKQNVIPKKKNEKVFRGCLTVPDNSLWTSIAI